MISNYYYIKRPCAVLILGMAVFGQVCDRLNAGEAVVRAQLDDAFNSLKAGRTFRQGIKTATQSKLINGFQVGLNGAEGTIESVGNLQTALTTALAVRTGPDGRVQLSDKGRRTAASLARTIADEALEAELFGYLALGNRDLINGTRLQFPGASDANDDYNNLPPSRHQNEAVDLRRRIYDGGARRDLRSLEYARLYFLEGIIGALDTLRQDVDPRLRTVDTTSSYPAGWTRWNQHGNGSEADNGDPSVTLPGFVDDSFASTDDQWSLTAGAQLGKIVRRYGGTVVTIGDKLWRKGYQHSDNSQVGVANNQPTSEDYLQEGVEQLRCGMHAQYLASLPLAATLSDGGAGRLSEYQEARIGDVVASVDQAEVLMRKIQDGIRPLIIEIIEGWSKSVIEEKAQDVREALAAAQQAWSIVLQKRSDSQNQDQSVVSEKRLRRSNFQYRLWQISGIHPEDVKDPDGGTDPLDTVAEREAYFEAVVFKAQELLSKYDPTSSSFEDTLSNAAFPDPLSGINAVVDGQQLHIPPHSPNAPNSSELAFAALRFAQHVQSLKSLLKQYSDIDRKIAIIEGKTNRINEVDRNRQLALGAIDAAVAIASSVKTAGPFVEIDPGKIVEAAVSATKRTISAVADASIRDAETDAVVANMFIEKEQIEAQLPEINLGIKTASLDIQRLLGETSQQLADYAYYIDVLPGDLEEWFYDPEIRFAKQAAEERYEQLVRALQQEAYILARHLEEAWLEPYEFPAIDSSGTYKQYTTDVDGASEYPDAEAVFNGLDFTRVQTFLAALKDWDEFMRDERFEGTGRLETKEVSLRKQVFQLPDYRWDAEQGRFVFDASLEADSIREFRALMIEAREKGRTSGDGLTFRLEFPIDIGLFHEVAGVGTEPVFSNFDSRREWNRRITDIGLKFVGRNVSQGSPTEPGNLDASLFLHGTTWRRSGQGLPAAYRPPSKSEKTDLTLYQYDPGVPGEEGKQLFVQDVNVLVGNSAEVVFNSDEFNSSSRKVDEWPFNCDTWILTTRARANFDNITDVVLRIAYTWGHPAPFNLAF
jgi:hypothetical protein